MGGLKLEIRQKVHTHRPETRWHVMQLLRDVEAETEGVECMLEGHNQKELEQSKPASNWALHDQKKALGNGLSITGQTRNVTSIG